MFCLWAGSKNSTFDVEDSSQIWRNVRLARILTSATRPRLEIIPRSFFIIIQDIQSNIFVENYSGINVPISTSFVTNVQWMAGVKVDVDQITIEWMKHYDLFGKGKVGKWKEWYCNPVILGVHAIVKLQSCWTNCLTFISFTFFCFFSFSSLW